MQGSRLLWCAGAMVAACTGGCGGGDGGVTDAGPTSGGVFAISVYPAFVVVPIGLTQQFTATASFADHTTRDVTTEVTWASSSDVATISNDEGTQGLATSHSTPFIGTAKISASLDGVTAAAYLMNAQAALVTIAVTPTGATAPALTRYQFQATATFSSGETLDITLPADWRSSDPAVAAFSLNRPDGEAELLAPGTATITASRASRIGSAEFTVTEAD